MVERINKKKIDLNEVRTIQMDITEAFHHFCVKNGIKYSLGCGSLLGAIRHNGYIPWDDDIDVYLKREDYEKLVQLFPSRLNDRYAFISLERDKTWNKPYGKIYDDRTLLIEPLGKLGIQLGINIDVFPIDFVPENGIKWKCYDKVRRFLQYSVTAKTTRLRKNRKLSLNIIVILLKALWFFFPVRQLGKLCDYFAQIYNGKEKKYLFETSQGERLKEPFLASAFDEVSLHDYEDRKFYVMSGYDEYLSKAYGNYMQLPPEEKRYTHNIIDAYWL